MPATSSPADAVKQITYLAAALKAPRITDAAARLADQARDSGWSFEDYLAVVLEPEVSARNASGAELRIKGAGFPARKKLEDFDWDAQPTVRQQVAALASGGFLLDAQNVVLLRPPGREKHTWRPRSGSSPPGTGIWSCSRPRPTGSPALAAAHAAIRVLAGLRAAGTVARYNIGVVDWFNEEGCRFKPSMMGRREAVARDGLATRDPRRAALARPGSTSAARIAESCGRVSTCSARRSTPARRRSPTTRAPPGWRAPSRPCFRRR